VTLTFYQYRSLSLLERAEGGGGEDTIIASNIWPQPPEVSFRWTKEAESLVVMEVVRVSGVMGVVVSSAAAAGVVIFSVWRWQDGRNGGRCGGRAVWWVDGRFCIRYGRAPVPYGIVGGAQCGVVGFVAVAAWRQEFSVGWIGEVVGG